MNNTQSSENQHTDTLTLGDLRHHRIWCAWQEETEQAADGTVVGRRKMAYGAGQLRLKSTDPTTWVSLYMAQKILKVLPKPFGKSGVGVVLGPLKADAETYAGYALAGVDVDACLDENRRPLGWAQGIVDALDTMCVEVSPSERGLKGFALIGDADLGAVRGLWNIGAGGWGRKPTSKLAKTGGAGGDGGHAPGVEFYHAARWFALTTPAEDMVFMALNVLGVEQWGRIVEATRAAGFDVDKRGMTGRAVRSGDAREYMNADELAGLDDAIPAVDVEVWERLGVEDRYLRERLETLEVEENPDRSRIAQNILGVLRGAGIGRDSAFKLLVRNGVRGWVEEKGRVNGGRGLMRAWNSQAGRDQPLATMVLPKPPPVAPRAAGAAATPPEDVRVVALRYDAATVRRLVEAAPPDEVARLFVGLVATADLDPLEREELVSLVAARTKPKLTKGAIREKVKEVTRAARKTAPGANADWQNMIQRNSDGDAFGNLANAMLFLRWAPELIGIAGYDRMMRRVQLHKRVEGSGLGEPGPLQDADVSEIQEWLQRNGLTLIGRDTVQQALNVVARENGFHPVQDYLNALSWDTTPRLDTWLNKYLGAQQPTAYLKVIGRCFILSMINRIMRPGCQCDYMIVLEGLQGDEKTKACNILAGAWFSNSLPDLHGHDDVRVSMHLRGKWLIEIGELSAFKKSDMDKLKNFLTRRVENYTPKYGQNEVDEGRQCVMIGTTNEKEYLRDTTGGRRFWPVEIGEIKINELAADRDQLFAEAMQAYRNGEQYWPSKDVERELIKGEQEARYEVDIWEDTIAEWLQCPGTDISASPSKPLPPVVACKTKDIALGALRTEVSRQDVGVQRRIAGIMRRLGWKQRRNTREWSRPEHMAST